MIPSYLDFYSYEQISPRLYLITEGYSMVHRFTIGVVVGDEKVLVIDSGMGLGGNLRQYVEKLVGTERPILCAVTHNHPDHAGGAITFDEAYCSHLDYPSRNDFAFSTEQRLGDLEGFGMDSPEVLWYCKSHYIENTETIFLDIKDGDEFDLGGVTVTAIGMPGHSAGSMAFYNREEGYVFTGDAVNTDTHLKKLDREGFLQYKKTLERFLTIVGEDAVLYPAHLPFAMSTEVAKNLICCCEELAEGKTAQDPPGETIFKERANNADIRMHYVGNTCIVYNRRLILGEPGEEFCIFSYERVSEHVYIVTENYSMVHRLTIGVVVGAEKILVIDSGLGLGESLRAYIEGFIGMGKVMECACTHGHAEHIGSAGEFDKVYLNREELLELGGKDWEKRRFELLDGLSLYNWEMGAFGRRYICSTDMKIAEVKDGDWFQLGDVTVEAIAIPGHTKGHMAYYCKEENIVFSGDGANVDIRLKHLDCQAMLEYRKTLMRFMSRLEPDVKIFAAHTNRPHGRKMLEHLAKVCEEITSGKTWGDPPGETILRNHIGRSEIRMHYYGNTCVVYDEDLIRI